MQRFLTGFGATVPILRAINGVPARQSASRGAWLAAM